MRKCEDGCARGSRRGRLEAMAGTGAGPGFPGGKGGKGYVNGVMDVQEVVEGGEWRGRAIASRRPLPRFPRFP